MPVMSAFFMVVGSGRGEVSGDAGKAMVKSLFEADEFADHCVVF
jgi:hypothetical protein